MSARDLAARVDELRRQPDSGRELVGMLSEQSPSYAGLGTNETERVRGYVLASFESAGLPPEGVPFVLEELELGNNPYAVAAAARALRGAREVPPDAPSLLVRAIERLRGADDAVSFDRFTPAPAGEDRVTALTEMARTLAELGPRGRPALEELRRLLDAEGGGFSPVVTAELARAADALETSGAATAGACCSEHEAADAPPPTAATELADLPLEDQDGTRLSFSEAFAGRPAALTFFYTRCQNPGKCSLTVTRLARLARSCAAEGLEANVAGITYDPAFDRPARLQTYGADRGMTFSARCRLLRTLGPFDPVGAAFELGVGFGPVTVNRHRLDLVVLNPAIAATARFERRLWRETAVLDALRAAAEAPPSRPSAYGRWQSSKSWQPT
jgi:cytochrome oxidase Cu insertion factor (SCO1/SenC/PrrC family)